MNSALSLTLGRGRRPASPNAAPRTDSLRPAGAVDPAATGFVLTDWPAGATVSVDGNIIDPNPDQFVPVPAGSDVTVLVMAPDETRQIRARLKSHPPRRIRFEDMDPVSLFGVSADVHGNARLYFPNGPALPSVTVDGDVVFTNVQLLDGGGNLFWADVPPGEHVVRIIAAGPGATWDADPDHRGRQATLQIEAGQFYDLLPFDLEQSPVTTSPPTPVTPAPETPTPLPTTAAPTPRPGIRPAEGDGFVTISVHPRTANFSVQIGSQPLRSRAPYEWQLQPGIYPATVSAPGYVTQRFNVTVAQQQVTYVDLDLVPVQTTGPIATLPPSSLVTSAPSGMSKPLRYTLIGGGIILGVAGLVGLGHLISMSMAPSEPDPSRKQPSKT